MGREVVLYLLMQQTFTKPLQRFGHSGIGDAWWPWRMWSLLHGAVPCEAAGF